ncbi:MAG: hypothetical protein AAGA11_05120 [Pseudomonadota bacterium]
MLETGRAGVRGGLGDQPDSWQLRGDSATQQRALACATGQFKRGNERRTAAPDNRARKPPS